MGRKGRLRELTANVGDLFLKEGGAVVWFLLRKRPGKGSCCGNVPEEKTVLRHNANSLLSGSDNVASKRCECFVCVLYACVCACVSVRNYKDSK